MTQALPTPGHASHLLAIESVSKRFPGVRALHEIDLTLESGEVHALLGQNGAGKSTLVKCISGVHPPDEGRIALEGEEISGYTPKRAYEAGIAVVHQRPQLLPALSVSENILLGQLPVRGRVLVDRSRALRGTRELLERLRLEIDPETPVAAIGPAERQQLAIAKALFREAKLLILDEPTAALDAERSERLFELLRDLTRDGVGILYVSHHLEEVFGLADRITVLRDGEVVATQPTGELSQDAVVTLMAGRRLEAVPAAVAVEAGKRRAVLEVEHLQTALLHDADFTVHEGEVVGVTGVIGAGGHSLARVAFGLDRPLSGRLVLDGRPYAPRGPKQAIRKGVFLVPEDPDREGLVPILPIATNVTLVDLRSITRALVLSLRRERELASGYVRDLSIATASVSTPVRNLSGGNRQKVLLAKALNAQARLLVLEEPTQGVDVHAKAEIHRIVRDLAEKGKAVMIISSDIRDLLEFVDRVIALRAGRVVGDVPAAATDYAQLLDLTVGAAGAAEVRSR